ncbi:MAG: flagellar biosynthetic protein FliO [Deltaproteobacteria bacterium]|nr:flagellar biosynthetic protein FliO [Candidatus Anaeroferrophillus wilburensis]MBN2889586.1 flagellar biosynthetic protein FliO [Deltaproteobacteria bacterium]
MIRICRLFALLMLLGSWFFCLAVPVIDASSSGHPLMTTNDEQIFFTVPVNPGGGEVEARFIDAGTQVWLPLPHGLLINPEPIYTRCNDEWLSGYGLQQRDGSWYWQFDKRDAALSLTRYLAVHRDAGQLIVTLFKPYRPLAVESQPASSGAGLPSQAPSVNQEKLAKINTLLAGAVLPSVAKEDVVEVSSPNLLSSGLRIFGVLAVLVALILFSYRPIKRLLRKTGGTADERLVTVLQTVPIGMKRQVMFLDIAGEVLVVGISGDTLSMLTKIDDPEKVEALRLLQTKPGKQPSFMAVIRSLGTGTMTVPKAMNDEFVSGHAGYAEAVEPDCYRQVVDQIKDRLHGLNQI